MTATAVTAQTIIDALSCGRSGCDCNGSSRRGRGKVHCPAHDDPNPSLNVTPKDGGGVLLKCFGGCSQDEVIEALRERGLWGAAPVNARPTETRHAIRDVSGKVVAVHVRQDFPNKSKKVWWETPDGKKGLGGIPIVDLPLFGIDSLNGAKATMLVEGEKARDALDRAGIPSVATVTGASSTPSDEVLRTLLGKTVYIWADNDDDGCKHMDSIAAQLQRLGHQDVRIIDWPDAGPKDDAYDYLALGHTIDDVRELCRIARAWTPNAGILSDATTTEVPSERKIKFHTARDVAAITPEEVSWIMGPWVAEGSITEVDAKIKIGKTDWLTHGCRQVLDGLPFMGEPTSKTPIVYLSEQPPRSFRETLRRADLLDRDDFHILFWHDTAGADWPAVVRAATEKAVEVGAKLLITDTLPQFAGLRGDAENNAGAALEAMEPLQAAASVHGLAVVIVRHERKGGGEVGDSARGSSAFGGSVDVVISLRRGDGNTRPTIRVIHALSRFDETPDTLVIERTPDGYIALGDEIAVAASEARTSILEHAPKTEENALTKPELLDKLEGVKSTTAQTVLEELMNEGLVRRVGEGKKGSPYRYWQPLQDKPEKHSDDPPGQPSETKAADETVRGSLPEIHSDGTSYIEASETNQPATCNVCGGPASPVSGDCLKDDCEGYDPAVEPF